MDFNFIAKRQALSQRGQLVIGLLAIGVLAFITVVIGFFFSSQTKTGQIIAKSAGCAEIANSISDYLKQDESSLFVNSVGIDSDGTFADYANTVTNIDGNSRFAFVNNLQVINSNLTTFTIPDGEAGVGTTIPAGTTFDLYNYLNENNSFNRVLSLAYAANICATNGAVIFNNVSGATVSLIYGITIDRPNTKITLKTDIAEGSQSICSDDGLTRLPSLYRGLAIKYKIDVEINSGTSESATCSASGSLLTASESGSPIALMHISPIDLIDRCNVSAAANTYCISGARRQTNDIVATVRTVISSSTCQTCLAASGNRYASCGADLTNTDLGAACATECTDTDPGSVLFCKLTHREQTTNLDQWWPCHKKPNSIPGTATVTYEDNSGSIASTQRSTRATIRISNLGSSLPPARDWLLDVRAIDTNGTTFGPSFSSVATQFNDVPGGGIPEFDDCSCDGSCGWQRQITTPCGAAAAPACVPPAGAGTETPVVPPQIEVGTVYCADPNTPATPIQDSNCLLVDKPSENRVCTLPCVAAGAPLPNYQCNYSGFSACAGTPPEMVNTAVCEDISVTPAVVVADANCPGGCPDQTIACGSPTYSCQNPSGWSSCTPTCLDPCEETQTSTCTDDTTGDPAPGNCGPLDCTETRTNYAEGCTYSCDITSVTASACSAGPCNLPGQITYTGAVCKDSDGAVVDVSNCGGDCNPAPIACARTPCTESCVASGAWAPACPGAPADCAAQATQFRSQTCQYVEDSTPCTTACPDATQQCPIACSDCGGTPHGGEVRTPTYPAATTSCEYRNCVAGADFVQTCNNGNLDPAVIPGGTITSCTQGPALTDGNYECLMNRTLGIHGSGCTITEAPYTGQAGTFAVCGAESPECLQGNGTPADCCPEEQLAGGQACGRCLREGDLDICFLNNPYKDLFSCLYR